MTSFLQHIADKAVRYMNDGLPPETVGVFAKYLTKLDPLINIVNKTVGECGFHDLQPRLCYPPCPPGQHGVLFNDSPVCTENCPAGSTDLITSCWYGNEPGAYSMAQSTDRGAGRLAHSNLGTSSCAYHNPGWMGGGCMPGVVCNGCGSNEQPSSPCWCAPVCDANEEASLGNCNPMNICYPRCPPNFTGHLTMCNRNHCDGDDEEHDTMCYKKCQPGFHTPTGLVCQQDKAASTRFPYVRWTSECDPGDTDLGQAPASRFGMCWYGTGYFRVTNISGFSKMRITHSEFALDCTSSPRIIRLKCKIDCPIQINFEWGFKICTGLPLALCDDPVYPTYNHPHQINHALDVEFEISLPIAVDFKDVNVDLSGVQLHVSRIGAMEGVVAEAVSMVKPSIDTAATVIRNINIFKIDAIRDFQDKVDTLYQQFLPLVANGGQQIGEEIVKMLNEALKDPMGNDNSFSWPFVNAGDVCAPPGPPLPDFACGPNALTCSAANSEFGLFEGGCGRLKYVYPLTLWSAGGKSMSWMTNEKFGPDVGTQYLTQGGDEPRAFVFVPTAPNATTYHLALGELPGAFVTRTVIPNNPTVGYFVQVNDPVKTPPRGAGLLTAVFTIECGAAPGSIRIKVVDDKFPNLYLAAVPYPISWITYIGGSQTQVENPNRPGTFVPVNFDFYTNAAYPPEFGIPHGPISLTVPGRAEGLAVSSSGEVTWKNGNDSGLFVLEQNPFNERTFYMRFPAGLLQLPAAENALTLTVKGDSDSSILSFKEEYITAMIVQPYRNEGSLLYSFAVVSPKYLDMHIYTAISNTPQQKRGLATQGFTSFGIMNSDTVPAGFYAAFALTPAPPRVRTNKTKH